MPDVGQSVAIDFLACFSMYVDLNTADSFAEGQRHRTADGKDAQKVEVAASATGAGGAPVSLEVRKQARAVKPGSFMHLLMSSSHTADGSPFTDIEIIAQAFIFLLAGMPLPTRMRTPLLHLVCAEHGKWDIMFACQLMLHSYKLSS